jgi:hypothetical protein
MPGGSIRAVEMGFSGGHPMGSEGDGVIKHPDWQEPLPTAWWGLTIEVTDWALEKPPFSILR